MSIHAEPTTQPLTLPTWAIYDLLRYNGPKFNGIGCKAEKLSILRDALEPEQWPNAIKTEAVEKKGVPKINMIVGLMGGSFVIVGPEIRKLEVEK